MPTGSETIADPVMEKFVSNLQVHLNHSAEVIVWSQDSIFLIENKMEDVL